jgi:hypothetical protein
MLDADGGSVAPTRSLLRRIDLVGNDAGILDARDQADVPQQMREFLCNCCRRTGHSEAFV